VIAEGDEIDADAVEDINHVRAGRQLAEAGRRQEIAGNAKGHPARQMLAETPHHGRDPRQQEPVMPRIVGARIQEIDVVQLNEDVKIESMDGRNRGRRRPERLFDVVAARHAVPPFAALLARMSGHGQDVNQERGRRTDRKIGFAEKPRSANPALRKTLLRKRGAHAPLLRGFQTGIPNFRAFEINAGDIERFVADVTAGKTASDEKVDPRRRVIVRGGAGAARKVVRDLSGVFSFAIRSEIVPRNPCESAAVRKTDNRNERFLTLDEVTLLGAALDALEQEGVNPKAANIARLWALTAADATRSRTDLGGGGSRRRAPETADGKTGKSIRPLGMAAIAMLSSLARQDGSEFVFPAERGDGHYQGTKASGRKPSRKRGCQGSLPIG
jgi:hypothetical protein